MPKSDIIPSRAACEFRGCHCTMFVGYRDSTCTKCGHGDCWHEAKAIDRRFVSTRPRARIPCYRYVCFGYPE